MDRFLYLDLFVFFLRAVPVFDVLKDPFHVFCEPGVDPGLVEPRASLAPAHHADEDRLLLRGVPDKEWAAGVTFAAVGTT